MVSSIGAYQQQVQIQQPVAPARDKAPEVRERDQVRDDVVVSRKSTEGVTRSNEGERSEDNRRALQSLSNENVATGGKDSAQRRGSLLDITA